MPSSAASPYSSRKVYRSEKQSSAPICMPDFRRQGSARKNLSMIARVLMRSGLFKAEVSAAELCYVIREKSICKAIELRTELCSKPCAKRALKIAVNISLIPKILDLRSSGHL